MVKQITSLHKQKEYKTETLFIAVYISDKYLSVINKKGGQAPDLTLLACICMLMAAKVE